jgi:hypothetical protein
MATNSLDSDLKWVRWESYKRYHAVYVEALGVYWTYCGRSRRPSAVFAETSAPPACCQHCRSRIRYSFLVPESLKALRGEDAASGPAQGR